MAKNKILIAKNNLTPKEVIETIRVGFKPDKAYGVDGTGLRQPQVGALHAIVSHWTVDPSKVATVVMPTGTGKTETMLATIAATRPTKLLVIVPTSALRKQISQKIYSWGILKNIGVIDEKVENPIVGVVSHKFKSQSEADEYIEKCNVIVSTVSALEQSEEKVRSSLMSGISHIFIDEAHHTAAKTWDKLKEIAKGKPILQFTATPYRNDGKRIEGKIIYSYPLSKAQSSGYFSQINYHGIVAFKDKDVEIAKKAINLLKKDLDNDMDHRIMARVRTKERAVAIHEIYKKIAAEYNPVVIYSGISNSLKKDALQQIESGTSKIIVCVNMLGEGYDLPQLKIAAMHDVHKSLAITLQFIGRFARVSAATTIGEASVVVERSGFYGDDNLARLYSSDPDWNKIIVDLSENAVEEQEEINDFENDFKDLPPEISLKNLLPKMSTVIYKTKVSNWKPHSIYEEIPKSRLYTNKIALNDKDQVAWFVTKDKSAIPWGNVEGLDQLSYNLYILYWDKTNKLLYIYSSNKDTVHARIAKAVCGESAELQHGNVVYRALANVNRLIPTTVGLLDGRNRKRQFTMYSGPNVTSGLPNSVTGTKVQTNMFGSGYEAGKRVDLGISLKGRIWSRKAAPTLMHWKSWCDYYGAKIIDSTIDVDTIMNQFLIPKFVENRPSLIPLSLAWPFSVYLPSSDGAMVSINGKSQNISDCELILKNHIKSGPISFFVEIDGAQSEYQALFDSSGISYKSVNKEAKVKVGKNELPLSDFLNEYGLGIYFEKDTSITHSGYLLQYNRSLNYDEAKIIVINWDNINIRKESQGPERDQSTIQARAIEHLIATDTWDLIIDDDGPGEVADIVAMKIREKDILVNLTHCKYSSESTPGARVEDLYDVCGQASKSMVWGEAFSKLIKNLIRREKNRQKNDLSGIIIGDESLLVALESMEKYKPQVYTVTIVQPGLSKAKISLQQKSLLACVETYLHETHEMKLEVIASR